MLLFWSIMQSNGGVLRFLNTFLFIFLKQISYNFLYFDMSFLIHCLMYLVVIFLACIFVIMANIASSFIHFF